MISGDQLSTVSWIINSEDFLVPLDVFTRINVSKPEATIYVKNDIIPIITVLTNGIIGFNFCLVTLVNEDLPNALVNLKYCGEYSLTIETSPDGITWSTLWTDLLFVRCEEIPYIYN